MSKAAAVTDASFAADVLNSDIPVVVDFWAEWCGPCRMVGPVLDEIAKENAGKLKVVKLNIDENPRTTRDYSIRGIPVMMIFSGGEVVASMVGAKPKRAIMEGISPHIG